MQQYLTHSDPCVRAVVKGLLNRKVFFKDKNISLIEMSSHFTFKGYQQDISFFYNKQKKLSVLACYQEDSKGRKNLKYILEIGNLGKALTKLIRNFPSFFEIYNPDFLPKSKS